MAQPIRILHVEDTRVYRGVIGRLLGQEPGKYALRQVPNRSEFEAAFAEAEFDLVLTDLHIGDIDGLEVLDLVRGKHPDLPVIVVTGTGTEETALQAWQHGAADYVLKSPKHLQHLPITIDAVLEKARLKQGQEEVLAALRQSEERHRAFAELASDFVYVYRVEPDGHFLSEWVSDSIYRVLGYSPAKYRELESAFATIHPDDLPANQVAFGRLLRGESVNFDVRVVTEKGEIRWLHNWARPQWDEQHTRVVRFFGAAQDITERKQAEAIVACQSKVLEQIATGTPLPETMDTMLRLMEQFAPGMLCSVLLLEDDGQHVRHVAAPSLPDAFNRAIDGRPIGPCAGSCGTAAFRREEVTVADIASDPLWTDYRDLALAHGLRACWSTPIFDKEGVVLGTFAIYYREPGLPNTMHRECIRLATGLAAIAIGKQRDEAALRESEERYRTLVEQARDGIALMSDEGRFQDVNSTYCTMTGYTHAELLGMHARDLIVPEQHANQAVDWAKTIAGGPHLHDWLVRRKDGTAFPAEVNAELLPDGRVLGMVRDITERKLAEMAVHESMRKLRTTINNLPGFVYRCANQPDWPVELVSEGVFEVLGYPAEEFMSGKRNAASTVLPADRDRLWNEMQAAIEARRPYVAEYRAHTSSGEERWLWEKGVAVFDGDAPVALEGFVTDITERKRAEALLNESQQRLKLATESARIGIWDWDVAANKVVWDTQMYALYGIRPQDFGGAYEAWEKGVHPEDRERAVGEVNAALEGTKDFHTQFRVVWPNGEVRHIEAHGVVQREVNGSAVRMLGANWDITERKQAEAALRLSEARFRKLFENAPDGIMVIDPQGCYLETNSSHCRLLGYSRDEIIGRHISDFVVPSEVPRVEPAWSAVQATADHHQEWQMRRKDGSAVAVDAVATVMPDGNVLGMARDITERKRAEAVRERLSHILEASLNEIYVFAADSLRFQYVNAGACRNLGYGPDTLRTMTPLDIKPGFTATTFANLLAPLIRREQAQVVFETVHRRADGSLYPVETHLQLVELGGERLFLAIILDITDRKLAEQSLGESNERLQALSRRVVEVQEEERRNLARELHDEIGQVLTSVNLGLHAVRSIAGPAAKDRLMDCLDVVALALDKVRGLSLDLRPSVLDMFGLPSALRWLGERMAQQSDCTVKVEISSGIDRLSPPIETACFRIAQEALTNVTRHARARNATVRLDRAGDTLHLAIQDDGIGFDSAAVERNAKAGKSFGVLGMRERVELLAGRFEVRSAPGQGTTIRAHLPLKT